MTKKTEITPKSIKINYIYNMVYEIFALLTPLITTPYISRILGAEGVGVYSYTNSIAQIFILFGNLGVATYGQMAIAACKGDRKKVSIVFYELWILRAITMLLSLGVYITFSMFTNSYEQERMILSVLIFASIFDITWLFRGIEDFSRVVIRNFIVKISIIVLIFTFVKTSSDVELYIFLITLSTLLGNLSFIFSMHGVLCKVDIKNLKIWRHTKQCLIFFIPTIATSVYTVLDKTMLGIYTEGTLQNGYYEQAHKIEQILIVVITSLNTIMRSRMSSLFHQGKFDEMHEKLKQSLSFILFIAIPMTSGLIAIAPNLVIVFLGEGFIKSISLLRIFALLIIIIGLSNCLNTHFLGPSGRQEKNNYILICGAVVNFILNYFSIPKYGAVGAATASVIAEIVILFGYLYLMRDFMKASIIFKLSWRYLIAGIFMGIIASFVGNFFNNAFSALIIQMIVGIVSYGILVILFQDSFIKKNLAILKNKCKKIVRY